MSPYFIIFSSHFSHIRFKQMCFHYSIYFVVFITFALNRAIHVSSNYIKRFLARKELLYCTAFFYVAAFKRMHYRSNKEKIDAWWCATKFDGCMKTYFLLPHAINCFWLCIYQSTIFNIIHNMFFFSFFNKIWFWCK